RRSACPTSRPGRASPEASRRNRRSASAACRRETATRSSAKAGNSASNPPLTGRTPPRTMPTRHSRRTVTPKQPAFPRTHPVGMPSPSPSRTSRSTRAACTTGGPNATRISLRRSARAERIEEPHPGLLLLLRPGPSPDDAPPCGELDTRDAEFTCLVEAPGEVLPPFSTVVAAWPKLLRPGKSETRLLWKNVDLDPYITGR